MILRLVKQSGTPVDEAKALEFQEEWNKVCDKVFEEFGKNSEDTVKALEQHETELKKRFEDAIVKKIEFPKTKKAWKELLDTHGAVMMCTNVESGDMFGVIPDMDTFGA